MKRPAPWHDADLGQIVILNGAPRSGKSSIARIMLERFPGLWVNLGVDAQMAMIGDRLKPGIGLRPGGEHPQKEATVVRLYAALHEAIAAQSRLGIHVVADLGYHDDYSAPLHVLEDAVRRLAGLPVLFVGIRCSPEAIMARRAASPVNGSVAYLQGTERKPVPAPVLRWQTAVHEHHDYDLEIDTTAKTAEDCAREILSLLDAASPEPRHFEQLWNLLKN